MNKTIKTIIAVLAVSSSITFCQAQSSANSNTTNKFFTEWGYSPFLGFEKSPVVTYTYVQTQANYNSVTGNTTYSNVNVSNTANFDEYDYWTFIFRARYNLTEFNNNASLSISVLPAIGIGGPLVDNGVTGALSLNIPLIVDYNIGNVATYTSDQDKGFVIGVGIEYTKAPLIGGSVTVENNYGGPTSVAISTGWVEPVLELGYRYWNKRNKAKEFNLKLGYGSNGAFTARLSWLKCIGY
jgi:hypothetical protein